MTFTSAGYMAWVNTQAHAELPLPSYNLSVLVDVGIVTRPDPFRFETAASSFRELEDAAIAIEAAQSIR